MTDTNIIIGKVKFKGNRRWDIISLKVFPIANGWAKIYFSTNVKFEAKADIYPDTVEDQLKKDTGTYWNSHKLGSDRTVFSISDKIDKMHITYRRLVNFEPDNPKIEFEYEYDNFKDALNAFYAEAI